MISYISAPFRQHQNQDKSLPMTSLNEESQYSDDQLLAVISEHGMESLLHSRLNSDFSELSSSSTDQTLSPPQLKSYLSLSASNQIRISALQQATEELLKERSIKLVCQCLHDSKIPYLLTKGTALAYSLYESPSHRPRCDTDLIVDSKDRSRVRSAFQSIGAQAELNSGNDFLFTQYTEVHMDQFGMSHFYDVHWQISNRKVFAGLFNFDELYGEAISIKSLGNATALGNIDALILACIHPVMHHHKTERLIWIYDVHLLVESLSDNHMNTFVSRCENKGISPIVWGAIEQARQYFATKVPSELLKQLENGKLDDRIRSFIESDMNWKDEVISDLKASPKNTRMSYLREIVAPNRSYMFHKYQCEDTGNLTLAKLYLKRAMAGLKRANLKTRT